MDMLTAERIKEIRKSLEMNTTEFATQLGVTANAVARWEIGDRRPRWEMMEKINKLAENGTTANGKSNGHHRKGK